MKLNKTYKTLANAYKAAHGCDNFALYDDKEVKALVSALKAKGYTKPMISVALANILVGDHKIDGDSVTSVMFVLKQTDEGFAWDRVAHTAKEPLDEAPMVYFDGATAPAKEDKPKQKPRTRKPAPTRGDANAIDFKAFKGTTSEKNKALHAELVRRGLKDSRTDEYQEIWTARPWRNA